MIVDDDRYLLESLSAMLRSRGFQVATHDVASEALEGFRQRPADVVLTDVTMPGMDGIGFMERLRLMDSQVPVIFMTGSSETELALTALRLRVFDFIVKPFPPALLVNALENAVQQRRLMAMEQSYRRELELAVEDKTRQLAQSLWRQREMDRELVRRLSAAAEFRDEDTGAHLCRIGLYARRLAEFLGMPADFVESITLASPMHDIGKIGIPDAILLKPGALTVDEFQQMQSHTLIGGQILRGGSHPTLRMAATIALTHHERWDGSGYPHGLAGEDAPLPGRIVMLADQYDALRTRRVYKEPFSHERAVEIITLGDGRTMPGHFDPQLLAAFRELQPEFDAIYTANQEECPLMEGDEGETAMARVA
jgi:putative two-component system response regulator